MILEMIFAAGCGWYGARKLGNVASGLRSSIANLQGESKSPAKGLVAVFENATPEDQQVLLDLFAKYNHPQS